MREHPIPQDVTGYKFHIVGNMTLKQFAEVAIGVVVAVILYNTNLLALIKWPLMLMAVGFGGMLAFVPIEERPFDHWVTTFFKRLYKPTKFYWKKSNEVPFSFTYKKSEDQPKNPEIEIDLSPARRKRITEYLASVKTQQKNVEPWEQAEQSRVSEVLKAFEEVEVENVSAKPQKIKPNLTPKVRRLSSYNAPTLEPSVETPKEQTVFEQAPEAVVEEVVVEEIVESVPVEEPTPAAELAPTPAPEVLPEPEILPEPTEPILESTTPASTQVPAQTAPAPENLDLSQVKSNKALPFPEAPTEPNKIVGMVLTADEKLVDRATVAILNQGKVIRSVRSNLLGQFFITGTLPNGTFTIEISKQGMEFIPQQLALSGQVVPPIEIRASA